MHALVGANNSGKSTILKALDFLFNPSTSKINEECFWAKDTSQQIRVEGLFIDLLPNEITALGSAIRPDGTFFLARTASVGGGGEEEGDEEADNKIKIGQEYNKPQPKYEWLVEGKITGTRITEWRKKPEDLQVNGKSFFDFLEKNYKVEYWKEKAAEFVKQHLKPDDFEDTWTANPKGFPNVLKANLPHFELIPAVRDASDESKVLKTNPFGRLIHEILRTLQTDLRDDITNRLKETTRRLNREAAAERLPEVAAVEESMKGFLSEMMPADIEIEFQAPTVETLLTTPKIYVDDGFKGAIDGKGHGLQRAVIFSILRSYANLVTTKAGAAKRTLILGVEEPELYMHPTAQRTIRRMFRAIADGGDQVLFSTHSPLLVDVAYFDEIIRVEGPERLDGKPSTSGAKAFQLPMSRMIEDLKARHKTATPTEASMRERYGHAYTPTRNEGFFAKKVILVEGATEAYCLPIYGRALGHDFDTLGVAVIECGGKDQIDRLYRIFNELGIACYVLFDYDKGNTEPEAVKASKAILGFMGQSIREPASAVVASTFACFAETWEKDLRPEIGNHDQLARAARASLGQCGKPLEARFIATELVSRERPCIPGTVESIIENALKVQWCGSCLKKAEAVAEPKRRETVRIVEITDKPNGLTDGETREPHDRSVPLP